MRFVRNLLTWLRTRKRASTALTFDALLKRAERQNTRGPETPNRPEYLPSKGAAQRVALSLLSGVCLYGGIAAAVMGFKLDGWHSLLSFAAVIPLGVIALRAGQALCRDHIAHNLHVQEEWGWTLARILLWPLAESLGILFGVICAYLYYGLERLIEVCGMRSQSRHLDWFTVAWLRTRKQPREDTSGREDAIRRIPELIIAIINEERERLFGDTSPFVGLRKRIETELEEALRLHAYFDRRAMEAGTAERRTTAIERAAAVRDQLETERKHLDEWRARVDAELGAYRERVQGLGPEIDELVHYRALSRLEQSTAHLAAEVEAMIAEMTTDLLARVHGRCRELSGALHDASAHVAVAAAQTGDADRDVRIITDTVRELVRRAPTYDAKAVREELRRPTRTAVRG